MRFNVIYFIISAFTVTKATLEDDCKSCVYKTYCPILDNMSSEQQEPWLMRYQCQIPYDDDHINFYKYFPDRDGHFVCCSKIALEIKKNMKKPDLMFNPDYNEQDDFKSNNFGYPPGNDAFNRNIHPIYQHESTTAYNPRTARPNQPYSNSNPTTPKSYSHSVTNNGPSFGNQQNGGQCTPTNFPPKPETGCCGREATDAERITGSHNSVSINEPANLPNNWMTENNVFPSQPYNQLPLLQRLQLGYRNRRRRDIAENTLNITLDERIAGGKETEFEQFPWTVLLKTTFDYGDRRESFSCGGTLISSTYVLTAGHCVYDANGSISKIEVYLAEYNKQTFPTDCKNVLGVGQKCIQNLIMYGETVITHYQYNHDRLLNDIALIRLRENAPYTDYIRPICLLPINLDSPENSHLPLSVAGWGRNGRYRSDIKQSTVVNLVPQEQCKKYYPALTRNQLCAAGYTGEDTCKGDSGGPLMTVYGGKYYVVGIVSGKRADSPCGTSVPSLYTNVYHYLDWILNIIKN